jgi:hypothetical protein
LVKLSLKPGAEFKLDSLALGRMLVTLLSLDIPATTSVVLTSGSDGAHMAGSKHYTGEAIDIRSSNLVDPEGFVSLLQAALGPRFYVLLESNHIHVQVRKGSKYP